MLLQYGFGDVWMWQGVGDESLFLESFVQCVKDCYKQERHSSSHDMSKMSIALSKQYLNLNCTLSV